MPTNIKWKARSGSSTLHQWLTYLLISAILLGTLSFILWSRYQTQQLVTPFQQFRCGKFFKNFGDDLPFYADEAYNKTTIAFSSYISNIEKDPDLYDLSLMVCYCSALVPDNNNFINLDISLEEADLDMIKRSDTSGKRSVECDNIASYIGNATRLKLASDYSIVLVNVLLRMLVIWMVKKVGYADRTQETQNIMMLVFLIQFFNTGPLLILINADLQYSGIPLLRLITSGYYTDFSVRWYKDVSNTLISSMLINILAPIAEFVITLGLRFLATLWDRRFRIRNPWITRKTTIEDYI